MTDAQLEREKFAETGANMIGIIQRELDRDDLPPDIREIYTVIRDHEIDLTARWVEMARNAEHYDAILFGASPAVLARALRRHLTLGQLAQLTSLLRED